MHGLFHVHTVTLLTFPLSGRPVRKSFYSGKKWLQLSVNTIGVRGPVLSHSEGKESSLALQSSVPASTLSLSVVNLFLSFIYVVVEGFEV